MLLFHAGRLSEQTINLLLEFAPILDRNCCRIGTLAYQGYKQFPGKPAAEVSYKNKLTYRSVPVLSNTRVPQSNARAPDFNLQYKLTC